MRDPRDHLQVPSGRVFGSSDLELVSIMVKRGFIRWSEELTRLASGIDSRIYVYGREETTDYPEFLHRIGVKCAKVITDEMHERGDARQACAIGIPTAGTALAVATSLASWGTPRIGCRIMREKRKAHGAHAGTWVNGRPDHERHRYWLVDNVATNGESKVEGYDHLDEDAYLIKEVIPLIFVDRGQGAIGRLKALGHAPVVVYHLRDLTFAFGELGLWPKETVARAEEEIELHRRTYTL